jgi:hypothetical protein
MQKIFENNTKKEVKNMSEKYCVLNMKKNGRSDVKGLQDEANRTAEKYKNEIKKERTKDNYFFKRCDDWNSKITEVLEENHIEEKNKSVVLVTSVYSASSEFFEGKSRDEILEYFEKCFEFECRNGSVISAVVHFDEGTPHMQTAKVPVLDTPVEVCSIVPKKDEDGKILMDADGNPVAERYEHGKQKGRIKYKRTVLVDDEGHAVTHKGLSARFLFGNKVKMSKTQTEFWEQCGKPFGLERGEIRVETQEEAKEHLTEAQYKAEQIIKDAEQKAEQMLKGAETSLKAYRDELRQKDEELQEREKEALKMQNTAVEMLCDCLAKKAKQERIQGELQKREDALQARETVLKNREDELQTREQTYKNDLQSEAQKEMQRYKLGLKSKYEEKYKAQHDIYVQEVQKVVNRANHLDPLPNTLNDMLEKAIVPVGNKKYMKFGKYRQMEEDRRRQYITRDLPNYPDLPSSGYSQTGYDKGFGE